MKQFFIGIRINSQEKKILDELIKAKNANSSEIIRFLINETGGDRSVLEHMIKEIREVAVENSRQLQRLEELSRYTASLLAGLTRKASKNDPGEAERLIQTARNEAKTVREGKAKTVKDNEKPTTTEEKK